MKTKDWNKDFYIDNGVLYNENEYFVIEGFIKWFLSDDDRKNLIDEDEISYYDKENNKRAFCMVYSGVLRELVLSNVDIKATRVFTRALENRFENMIATINTAYLFEYYTKGYRQGLEDFNREYKIVSKDLLSNNCQSFIDDLRDKYFNVRTRFGKGWQSIKGFFPLRFHYSDIKILGYYAGLIASTDEMIQQMPTLFEGFYSNPDDAVQVDVSGCKKALNQSDKYYINKSRAKHFALTYYFESYAGIEPRITVLDGDFQKGVGRIFQKRIDSSGKKLAENTVRKQYDLIKYEDLKRFNNIYLSDHYGEDWKQIVLAITKDKEKMNTFFNKLNI